MVEADVGPFVKLLADVWALWPSAKPLSSGQATMFFRAVASFPLEAVQRGFNAHVKDAVRGRYPPTPADILAKIEEWAAADGRPGPEESWAIALPGVDENKTVIWTAEIAAAWQIAKPVLMAGDEVGARMSFKESYVRLVDEARAAGKPVCWDESTGFDPVQRVAARMRAQHVGRLPAPRSDFEALPAPELGDEGKSPEQVAGERARRAWNPPEAIREALNRTRDRVLGREPWPEDAERRLPRDVQRTQELKEAAQRKVDDYMQQHPEAFNPPSENSLPSGMRKTS